MNKSELLKKAMAYFIMPLLFMFLTYFIIYSVFTPVIKTATSLVKMMSSQNSISADKNPSRDLFAEKENVTENSQNGENDPSEPQEDPNTIKASTVTFPKYGDLYGKITIEGTSINEAPMYFGDSKEILKKGAGHYNGSSFPGCGSTVLVSGHNNREFNGLKEVKVGDVIVLETNYATYTYTVTEIKTIKSPDSTAYDLSATEENLVLYTCYPFDALGLTPYRYFVYASLTSGPAISLSE